MWIIEAPCREASFSGTGVVVLGLQLLGPDSILRACNGVGKSVHPGTPMSTFIEVRPVSVRGFVDVAFVYPVIAGMIEDNVQDDPQPRCMGGIHQVHQIRARTKPWIDLEKILDRVSVITIIWPPLLKYRSKPHSRHAKLLEVRKF